MAPTIVDIARETKTSISTVSRVLSGGPAAARISEATRKRVLSAAQRLGYRPNLLARSLRTRRSNTVALLVNDISNPWFGQLASCIEHALRRHGYSLILCNSGESGEVEEQYLRLLPLKGIDGLIISPLVQTRKRLFEMLPEGMPLVVVDRPIPEVECSVSSDQEQAAALLTGLLQEAGVRRIAIAAGPRQIITHRRRVELMSARFEVVLSHEGPADVANGTEAARSARGLQYDAMVTTNNQLALGAIEVLCESERPPIVACFDGIPLMQLLPVPVVSSVQDLTQMAEATVSLLLPQMAHESKKLEPIVLPTRAESNRLFQSIRRKK